MMAVAVAVAAVKTDPRASYSKAKHAAFFRALEALNVEENEAVCECVRVAFEASGIKGGGSRHISKTAYRAFIGELRDLGVDEPVVQAVGEAFCQSFGFSPDASVYNKAQWHKTYQRLKEKGRELGVPVTYLLPAPMHQLIDRLRKG
jgi:hypothetical protein